MLQVGDSGRAATRHLGAQGSDPAPKSRVPKPDFTAKKSSWSKLFKSLSAAQVGFLGSPKCPLSAKQDANTNGLTLRGDGVVVFGLGGPGIPEWELPPQ